MCFSSLKNTSDSLFPLGSVLQMLPLWPQAVQTYSGKAWLTLYFRSKVENFIRNFRFPTGIPVLTSLPVAQHDHIWHCRITNCSFIIAPLLSTHKTMGKCSSLNIYFRQWENMLILLSKKHPFWGTTGSKNAHYSHSNCNDGVTWCGIPCKENENSAPRTLYCTGNILQEVKPQATEYITALIQKKREQSFILNKLKHQIMKIQVSTVCTQFHYPTFCTWAFLQHAHVQNPTFCRHLKLFLSTAFTKWPFRLVLQEMNGLSAHRSQPPQ